MTLNVETQHPGEFLLTEGPGTISREAVVILSGQNLIDGAVLGKVTASSKFKVFDPTLSDGSENAAAILIGDVDATAGDLENAALARIAEVKQSKLVWKSGLTDNQKAAALVQLAALFIIARS